jgi:hypothetical protein
MTLRCGNVKIVLCSFVFSQNDKTVHSQWICWYPSHLCIQGGRWRVQFFRTAICMLWFCSAVRWRDLNIEAIWFSIKASVFFFMAFMLSPGKWNQDRSDSVVFYSISILSGFLGPSYLLILKRRWKATALDHFESETSQPNVYLSGL